MILGRADKKLRFEKISLFRSRDLFCIGFVAPVAPLGGFGVASGRPHAPKGGPGEPQGAILTPPRALQMGGLFRSWRASGDQGALRGLLGRFLSVF